MWSEMTVSLWLGFWDMQNLDAFLTPQTGDFQTGGDPTAYVSHRGGSRDGVPAWQDW